MWRDTFLKVNYPEFFNYFIDPDNEIIAINLSKDQFRNFMANLAKIMAVIKEKTNKIMVPISI